MELNQTPNTLSKPRFNPWLITTIVLAVLLIAGGAIFAWQKSWITYTNQQYGFEIKYPGILHVSTKSPEFLIISTVPKSESEYAIISLTYRNDIPIESFLEKYKGYKTLLDEGKKTGFPNTKTFVIEDIMIDTVKGYKITAIPKDGIDEIGILCFFPDKNNQGFFDFKASSRGEKYKEYGPIFDQILSTFKFTK